VYGLFVAESDPAFAEIVRAHSHSYAISKHNANAEATKFSGEVGVYICSGLSGHQEGSSGVHLCNLALNLD
jgi:hypothetical protein